MSAGSTNKFTDTFNSANPNVAKVTSSRTALATTLSCDNLAGWPTVSKVHFSTYQIDTNNAVVPGTQIDWEGVVSGNNIGTLVRKAGATDAGNAVGDIVEMNPTGSWGHDLYSGLTTEHNQDGTHSAISLTGNIKVNDSSTAIVDSSSNELVKFTKTASAVNEVTVANAATGNAPTISATGGDTNVGVTAVPKGTGVFQGFVAVKIGTIPAATFGSTGHKSVTGVGFKPKLVRFTLIVTSSTGATTVGFGAMDASGNQYYMANTTDGSTGRARAGGTTSCIGRAVVGGSPSLLASYFSMDSDGFTINVTTAENVFDVAYEAWG